jgi:hypothetical protein
MESISETSRELTHGNNGQLDQLTRPMSSVLAKKSLTDPQQTQLRPRFALNSGWRALDSTPHPKRTPFSPRDVTGVGDSLLGSAIGSTRMLGQIITIIGFLRENVIE